MSCEKLKTEWPDGSISGKHKNFVLKEKATKATKGAKNSLAVKNPNGFEYCYLKLDEHLPQSESQKACDFLLIKCPDAHAYFIEMKAGNGFAAALEQLTATISRWRLDYGANYQEASAWIISKGPDKAIKYNGPEFLKLKRAIRALTTARPMPKDKDLLHYFKPRGKQLEIK